MYEDQNFEVVAGDSKRLVFTLETEDAGPVTLTGASAEWVVASTRGSAALLTVSDGTVDDVAGTVTVDVTAAETAALDPRVYYHELELEDTGGNVATVASGDMTVLPDTA